MSRRGRSTSPRPIQDADVDMENQRPPSEKPHAKVVVITNITRNVVEAHLQAIFGVYGTITKIDLPTFSKSGQNRGKAALEYSSPAAAHKAASHMHGGQLDGAILKVELSELPVRSRSRSHSHRRPFRNTRAVSRSRSRSPPYRRRADTFRDSYRGRGLGRRGGRRVGGRSRSRSWSPPPRRGPVGAPRLPPRRRSPSYTRGGMVRRGRSRSKSRSVRSSRSRSFSRSRSRSYSYSSYSRYSRSRSRSKSVSRGRRSNSRDDIRDSRSRSPPRD